MFNNTPSNGNANGDEKIGIYAGAMESGSADNFGGAFDAYGGGTGNLDWCKGVCRW